MVDLGGFANQAAPVARDLNRAGADVSRMIQALGPFAAASRPAVDSLGEATKVGRPVLVQARPLVKDLRGLAANARPLSPDLDRVTKSVDETGGIERLMDVLYFSMLASNGYDGLGHYLRAGLIANLCTSVQPRAQRRPAAPSSTARPRAHRPPSATTWRPRLANGGNAPKADTKGSVPPQGDIVGGLLGPGQTPEAKRNAERIRKRAEEGSPALQGNEEPMLDYLLGSDR